MRSCSSPGNLLSAPGLHRSTPLAVAAHWAWLALTSQTTPSAPSGEGSGWALSALHPCRTHLPAVVPQDNGELGVSWRIATRNFPVFSWGPEGFDEAHISALTSMLKENSALGHKQVI